MNLAMSFLLFSLFSSRAGPSQSASEIERRAAAASLLKFASPCRSLKARLEQDETLAVRSIPLDMQNRCKLLGIDLDRQISEEDRKAWEKGDAGKLCLKNKDWPRYVCELVSSKRVKVGMTAAQVRAAWGQFAQSIQEERDSGIQTVWIYASSRVHFDENRFVTSVQTVR